MNKNTVYGLIVIGALLFGYAWYTSRQKTQFLKQQHVADSIQKAEQAARAAEFTPPPTTALAVAGATTPATASTQPQAQASTTEPAVAGNAQAAGGQTAQGAQTTQTVAPASDGGLLAGAKEGAEELFIVENDLAKFTFSNRGGRIASVELKKFNSFDGSPVVLFQPRSSTFDMRFFVNSGYNTAEINTGNYFFKVDTSAVAAGAGAAGARAVSMKLMVSENAYVEFLYTIPRDGYMIDFAVNFVGMNQILANQSELLVDWQSVSYQMEKSYRSENRYSSIFVGYAAGDQTPDNIGFREATQQKEFNARLRWVAFKQQFFSSVFIARGEFQNASVNFDTFKPETGKVKDFSARISIPFNPATTSYEFNFFFGPNKYSLLKSFDLQLQKLVPLGGLLVGWVNRLIVIPVFNFLGGFISSFGLIIFLLTLFIKILIMPLTYRSYISQAKMRLVKPEIDELAKKYPKQEDAMKKQQATMELYKKAGINPLGGCIPLLIQFPILIAMFYFFPASIELRGQSFLWATDLSSYDSILNLPFTIPFYGSHVSLFALLMAASVIVTSRMNYTQTASAGPQMAGMKFMMLYIMPVMMLLWFNDYASGLSYYYFLSNVITIGQTYAFRYAVDEKKLHAKMKANAKKPRKKSKWQERYEEMLKEQQRQAKKR